MNYSNESMTSSSQVCRACFAADVRLYDMHQNNMMEAYCTLLNTSVQVTDELPHYLCSYCAALLLKCNTFRNKCIDALKVFEDAHHLLYFTCEEVYEINKSTYLRQSEIENIDIVDETHKRKKSDISSESDLSFDSDDLSDEKSDCTVCDNDRKPNLKDDSIIKNNTEHDNPPKSSNNVIKRQLRTYFGGNISGILKDFKDNLNCESIKGMRNIRNKRMNHLLEIIDHIEYSSDVSNKLLKILDEDVPNYENKALKSVTNIIRKVIKQAPKSYAKAKTINEPEVTQTSNQHVQKDTVQDNPLSADTAKPDSKPSECTNINNGILKRKRKRRVTKKMKFTNELYAMYNIEVKHLSRDEQIKEFNDRKESENYKNRKFKCNICFKGFLAEETYQNHMLLHDDISGKFVCDICQCHFMTTAKLSQHKQGHTKLYTCKECGHISKHATRATEHYRWHNGKTYSCKDCGKEFRKNSTIYGHIKMCHPTSEQLVRCEICGDSFNGLPGLKHHDNKIHKEMRSPECYCSGCETQFYCLDAFKAHQGTAGLCITTHKYCVRCGMAFDTEELLKEHEIEQRKLRGYFECEVCHKRYKFFLNLKMHQRRHSASYPNHIKTKKARKMKKERKECGSEEMMICEVCGKSVKNAGLLILHYKAMHSDEKPFKCTVCSKGFKAPSLLSLHMRVHTGERPFLCQNCPKAFRSSTNLKRHILIHTGERPHSCHICGKSFQSTSSVKTHVQTVHMKIPMPPRIRRKNNKSE